MADGSVKPSDHLAIMSSRISDEDSPDFFPTGPWAFRAVAEIIREIDPRARSVWECAAGAGHGVHALRDYFPDVYRSDAYSYGRHEIFDFLSDAPAPFEADWIVTNPPFGRVRPQAFIRKACQRARRGVAMLLRAVMICGEERYHLFNEVGGLSVFAPFAERCPILENRWDPDGSTATDYAWFIFRKRHVARELTWRIPPGTERRLTLPSDAAFAVGSAIYPTGAAA